MFTTEGKLIILTSYRKPCKRLLILARIVRIVCNDCSIKIGWRLNAYWGMPLHCRPIRISVERALHNMLVSLRYVDVCKWKSQKHQVCCKIQMSQQSEKIWINVDWMNKAEIQSTFIHSNECCRECNNCAFAYQGGSPLCIGIYDNVSSLKHELAHDNDIQYDLPYFL